MDGMPAVIDSEWTGICWLWLAGEDHGVDANLAGIQDLVPPDIRTSLLCTAAPAILPWLMLVCLHGRVSLMEFTCWDMTDYVHISRLICNSKCARVWVSVSCPVSGPSFPLYGPEKQCCKQVEERGETSSASAAADWIYVWVWHVSCRLEQPSTHKGPTMTKRIMVDPSSSLIGSRFCAHRLRLKQFRMLDNLLKAMRHKVQHCGLQYSRFAQCTPHARLSAVLLFKWFNKHAPQRGVRWTNWLLWKALLSSICRKTMSPGTGDKGYKNRSRIF